MPSTKKPARAKRATPPRRVDYAKAFDVMVFVRAGTHADLFE